MPNINSAAKRIRSDAKKRERNNVALSEIKTLAARLRKSSSDRKLAEETAKKLISCYDRAVSRGILSHGRADRNKSRVSAFLATVKK